jgi:cytochrome c peroxidase
MARRPFLLGFVLTAVLGAASLAAQNLPNLFPFLDPTGKVATYDANGAIDTTNPFFQSLGTNGRSCATFHVLSNAMSLSAANAQARFSSSSGQDPLFAAVDGANCPNGTPGNADDHSLLLNNGLIHVSLPLPPGAQFSLAVVQDPYGCAHHRPEHWPDHGLRVPASVTCYKPWIP